jgi:hypothetical protein
MQLGNQTRRYIIKRLMGDIYAGFLQNYLPAIFENVPLRTQLEMYYQQDGTPLHFPMNVTQYLNEPFSGQWIGLGSPQNWPRRSSDLSPVLCKVTLSAVERVRMFIQADSSRTFIKRKCTAFIFPKLYSKPNCNFSINK